MKFALLLLLFMYIANAIPIDRTENDHGKLHEDLGGNETKTQMQINTDKIFAHLLRTAIEAITKKFGTQYELAQNVVVEELTQSSSSPFIGQDQSVPLEENVREPSSWEKISFFDAEGPRPTQPKTRSGKNESTSNLMSLLELKSKRK